MEERSSSPGGRHRHPRKRGAPSIQGRQLPLSLGLGCRAAWYPHCRDLFFLHTLQPLPKMRMGPQQPGMGMGSFCSSQLWGTRQKF